MHQWKLCRRDWFTLKKCFENAHVSVFIAAWFFFINFWGHIVCFDFFKPNDLTQEFVKTKTYKSKMQSVQEMGKFPGTEISVAAIPDKKMLDNDDVFFDIVFGGDKNDSDDENTGADSAPNESSAAVSEKSGKKKDTPESEKKSDGLLLTVVRSHGRIEIYELPSMRQVKFLHFTVAISIWVFFNSCMKIYMVKLENLWSEKINLSQLFS